MSLFKTIRYKFLTWQVWRVKRLLQRAERQAQHLARSF